MRSTSLACIVLCLALNTTLHGDTVILLDGQELDGTVTGVTDTQITLEKQGESIVVSKKLVSMIFIGPSYRNASPAKRAEMRKSRASDDWPRSEVPSRNSQSQDPAEQSRPPADLRDSSYFWLQVGPAKVNDLAVPLIHQIRNYALFTDLFPALVNAEQIKGHANFADLGWHIPLARDLYGELRISGYRLQGSAPKIGYELDIVNATGLNFDLVNGSLNLQSNDRFYYQATLGYQAALGDSGWIIEPRISAGYTTYNVKARSIVGGISPLTPAMFAAKDDFFLDGTWPSLGAGFKLRYSDDLDQSEYYLILEANRTQGGLGLAIAHYSAGGITGNGYRGADFQFTGYALLAELGYLHRILANMDLLINIGARKEQFTVNDSYYYATTPPVSSIEPLIPLSYLRAPQIREFSGESYSISFGLRLYY